MRTVTITKGLRKMIVDASDGTESVNSTIKKLVADAEVPCKITNMDRTVINLDDDVLARLEELKYYPKEPYNSVIFRLINSQ